MGDTSATNIKNYTCTPVNTQRAHEPVLIPIKQRSNIETNIEGPSKLKKKEKMEICEPYIQATFWIMLIIVFANFFVGIRPYIDKEPWKLIDYILDNIKTSYKKFVIIILGIIIPAILFALWLHFKIKSNIYPELFEMFAFLFAVSFTLFSLFTLLIQMYLFNFSKENNKAVLMLLIKILILVSPVIMFSQWYWTETVNEGERARPWLSGAIFISVLAVSKLLIAGVMDKSVS